MRKKDKHISTTICLLYLFWHRLMYAKAGKLLEDEGSFDIDG